MIKKINKTFLLCSIFLTFLPITTQAATNIGSSNIDGFYIEGEYSPLADHIGTGKKRSFIKENYVNGAWVLEYEDVYEWVEIRFENGFDRTYNNYNERVFYDASTNQPAYRTYYRTYNYSVY